MKADEKLIKWLIYQSGETMYNVSKKTTVTRSTLSRIKSGSIQISNLSIETGHLLTEYAKQLKKERGE